MIISGTVKQLMEKRLSMNGRILNQSDISTLVRLGIGRKVGEAEKKPGTKGKASGIYEFDVDNTVTISSE